MRYLLDNGAYTIKLGTDSCEPQLYNNCIASCKREVLIAPSSLVGVSEVLRPIDRGVLVDPELQLKLWKSILPTNNIDCLIYTCPLYSPPTSRKLMDELIFEDLSLPEALRVPSGPRSTCLILDLGFSSSTVIPYNEGKPIVSAIKRVTVGGKLMTNFMKEQISYRYFDMTEETWLVNIIREQMCYVSSNFLCELRKIQTKKICESAYVLPEHGDIGFPLFKPEDAEGKQVLNMSNLTITVPELLFNPSDSGIECAGIHEAIMQSVMSLPEELRKIMLENIVLVGGVALTKGILPRLQQEVQENSPFPVSIRVSENPVWDNWETLKNVKESLTKKDYEEMGSEYIDSIYQYS
ncbi:hypothetical protein SteCoe_17536 [Stentor coeruleus]|uniref:Uncharacterized protein n=1 Tax=Stentor coeruleus TaxID=5963 RepID=A0A1R2BZ23_9CILI|nr:hypothetical protein SteCoe_17536 [Stentor coeruleus]